MNRFNMKIKREKDQIIIAELDPNKDYICLVNTSRVDMSSLRLAEPIRDGKIPIVPTTDVNNAVRFVEVPKKKENQK